MSDLLALVGDRPAWMARAACTGLPVAMFYPDEGRGAVAVQAYRRARAICAGCPVRDDCLAHALALPAMFGEGSNIGIWAGTSPAQRRNLRRTP